MQIEGTRIRSLATHFGLVPLDTPIIVGLALAEFDIAARGRVGFSNNPEVNTSILPAVVGPVTRFNAEGISRPDRTQPMERHYRSVYRRWEDWHGNEHYGWVDVPYYAFPRIFTPPPAVEFRIASDVEGDRFVTTPEIVYNLANNGAILHRVNLFLESVGRCEVFTENLARIIQAPIRRLNWNVLPPGQTPWRQLEPILRPLIQRERPALHDVISNRLETINAHGPAFVALGQGGFGGYVIFAFPDRNMYLMESINFGNATYGFGEDWQTLSQRTKAEILNNNLHTQRVIHREGWHAEIDALFR